MHHQVEYISLNIHGPQVSNILLPPIRNPSTAAGSSKAAARQATTKQ